MKMIPSQILRKSSDAEGAVFEMLREIELGPGATALHSLNLPKHEYKKWAEADFVVISAAGILLLEVKGGGVACRDGMWEFTNRYGEVSRKRESPAVQARTAFFALRDNYLYPRFKDELHNVPAGWVVVFKDISHLLNVGDSGTPDQPAEITAFSGACVGHNTFGKFLKNALSYWASTSTGGVRSLTPESIAAIVTSLRPNFEQVPPLSRRIEAFTEDVTMLTDEQYSRLDELQENERIVVRGGAGTGKTFLAMACARYDRAQGCAVIVVTRSSHLVSFLQNSVPPDGVEIIALDSLSSRFAERGAKWKSLIIDEGQDICQMESLDLLDSVLEGGLELGRWRWFGDPNRQVSVSFPFDRTALDYVEGLAVKCRLKHNVRNTPKIIETIVRFAGADLGTPSPRGQGAAARFIQIETKENIVSEVGSILRTWMSGEDGVARSSIAVLVPDAASVSLFATELSKLGIRSEALDLRGGAQRNSVVVAAVEDFKGLERQLVCVAGLGSPGSLLNLGGYIYRAFSRANHTLAVVHDRQEGKCLQQLEAELAKQLKTK